MIVSSHTLDNSCFTDSNLGWCCLGDQYAVHARILRLCALKTEDYPPPEGKQETRPFDPLWILAEIQRELFKFSIIRPVKMQFLSPIVFLVSLYMAIIYSYQYLLFTTFPRVFQIQYGFSNGSVGLTYLGIGIGSFLGLVFCGGVSDRLVVTLTKRYGGTAKPEYGLPVFPSEI
jgi:hypothetical protein